MFCMAGFLTLRLSVCLSISRLSVCPLTKYFKNILKRTTSILVEAFRVTQGGKRSILKKKAHRGKGGYGRGGE